MLLVLAAMVLAACGTTPSTGARPAASRGPATDMVSAIAAPGITARRPNIVLVLTDDLTTDLLAFMPHVRRMQRAGASFSSYVVSDSLCCPSRTSLLTGRYPHSTGVLGNGGRHGGYGAFRRGEQDSTIATRLQAAGYRTGLMGKYVNGYKVAGSRATMSPVPPGWDRWFVAGSAGYGQFDYTVNDNGRLRRYGHRPRDYGTDVLGRKAGEFIRRTSAAGRPFLLEVAPFSPHLPSVPAPRHARDFPDALAPREPAFGQAVLGAPLWMTGRDPLRREQVAAIDEEYRRRARSAASLDDLVATVRQALLRAGVARNTYLVFTSDNGYHLGEHRLLAGKRTAFETDLRVPLVVDGPGIAAGSDLAALASNIDLAPTFLQVAGVRVPPAMEGRSLLGWLHGRPPARWRTAVLVDYLAPERIAGDPDAQSAASGFPTRYQAVRRTDGIWVRYADGGREHYDLTSDPSELDNTAFGVSEADRAAWERQLTALAACHDGPSCRAADRLAP